MRTGRRNPPMRLDGDIMVIGMKDASKLMGISILSACAVLVCTMFLNFYFDVSAVRDQVPPGPAVIFYEAQLSTAKVVCLCSGGCLSATSVIMLFFYIKHYIDTHKKELGTLKALGYSNLRIAGNFWVFGVSVLLGAAAGFGGAFLLMPEFYRLQNKDKILPEFTIHFHPSVLLFFVALPTAAFSILAVLYAWIKLKKPVLSLLRDSLWVQSKPKKHREGKDRECSFVQDLQYSNLRTKKILVFFMVFASFCFSAMTQMAFSMKDLSSVMMGVMILAIGLILACTTLLLAVTAVINGNTKTIAMMRVLGYSQKECRRALLDGYRIPSYLGFALGTVYQYGLLKLMVTVVFQDVGGVPEYRFDIPLCCVSLVCFLLAYEAVMYYYAGRIGKVPVKEVMLE